MQPMKNIVFENAYQKNARTLLDKLNSAEAILVGAAAGMSASCGYNFFYQNDAIFQKYLGDFHKKYGFTGAFNGFYYHYPSPEAHWAFLVRMGYMEYECPTGQPYYDLMELLEGKNYHIMTTNQDFQFTRVVSEEKLSAIQGDSRYYQCSRRCHDQIYYNKDMVYAMNAAIDENLCIPAKMIPRCPKCGAQMEPWVRGYTFLEGAKYKDEYRKINEFLEKNKEKKILFLELGVGRMTPMFIQEPFWNLTYSLPKAFYITINPKDAILPREIEQKGLAIKEDIALVLQEAVRVKKEENKEGKSTATETAAKSKPLEAYTMSKADRELSGNFAANRGKLPMPISGAYIITSRYGQYAVEGLRNVKLDNKGIDIQGKPGAQARAIFDGKVAAVFQLNGLFNVLIRHGNYISVYCNLSSASVKAGDTVKTKQSIGQVFSDGTDNGRTVLHFQLRREKEKLNPEPWLNR